MARHWNTVEQLQQYSSHILSRTDVATWTRCWSSEWHFVSSHGRKSNILYIKLANSIQLLHRHYSVFSTPFITISERKVSSRSSRICLQLLLCVLHLYFASLSQHISLLPVPAWLTLQLQALLQTCTCDGKSAAKNTKAPNITTRENSHSSFSNITRSSREINSLGNEATKGCSKWFWLLLFLKPSALSN